MCRNGDLEKYCPGETPGQKIHIAAENSSSSSSEIQRSECGSDQEDSENDEEEGGDDEPEAAAAAAAPAQQAAAAASSPLPQPSSKAAPSSAPSSSSDTPSDLAAFMLHRATPQGYVLKGKIQAAVSAKGLSLVKSGPCVWSILLCAYCTVRVVYLEMCLLHGSLCSFFVHITVLRVCESWIFALHRSAFPHAWQGRGRRIRV